METEALYTGKRGITGSTIKWIAIISMTIDHFAAIVLTGIYLAGVDVLGGGRMTDPVQLAQQRQTLYVVIGVMRSIGRLGFPLFCFLLLEGFMHTRNVKKYMFRMGLFALISEIPFDLGFAGKVLAPGYQNVFFTLFAGLLVIAVFRYVQEKKEWSVAVKIPAMLVALAAGGLFTEYVLMSDYGMTGVLTIAVIYLLRTNRTFAVGSGGAVLTVLLGSGEAFAFLAAVPVHFYNGKRGWNMKYFFYLFYPLHILFFYLLMLFLTR